MQRGDKDMRYKTHLKWIWTLFLIISILMPNQMAFANNEDIKKDIAQFHYSVMNEGGYITCTMDITENPNHTYKLDMMFKENINGVNLGFYTSPYILQFMEVADMEYDSGFEGSYLYTVGSGEFESLEKLSELLSRLTFVSMVADKREFFANIDLTIWDDVRKEDNFVDDIYKTNYFLLSYKPLKEMDTNANRFENGMYIWRLGDGRVTGAYATSKESHAGWIIAIVGIIVFAGGIYLILKNPFKNRPNGPNRPRGNRRP